MNPFQHGLHPFPSPSSIGLPSQTAPVHFNSVAMSLPKTSSESTPPGCSIPPNFSSNRTQHQHPWLLHNNPNFPTSAALHPLTAFLMSRTNPYYNYSFLSSNQSLHQLVNHIHAASATHQQQQHHHHHLLNHHPNGFPNLNVPHSFNHNNLQANYYTCKTLNQEEDDNDRVSERNEGSPSPKRFDDDSDSESKLSP